MQCILLRKRHPEPLKPTASAELSIPMTQPQKSSKRFSDLPRDRPHREGCEHANLERPGAKAHPRATGWQRPAARRMVAWRLA